MKSKQIERVWVHKRFKQALKVAAAEKNVNVVDLTEDIAMSSDPLTRLKTDIERKYKKKRYDFL